MSGDGPVRAVISHEEITALKLTEEALREGERQLNQQKTELEEANIALKVLLKQRQDDKSDHEQKVITNVKEMVLPYVEKLKRVSLKPKDKRIVEIIDSHLQDIISPMIQKLANASTIMTPQVLPHPLTGKPLDISMTLGQISAKEDERGGSSIDWVGLLTEGPGMQAVGKTSPPIFSAAR